MAKISESVEVANLSELGDYIDNTPGLAIPTHDYFEITSEDANHNPLTIIYKQNGTLVATVTLTWDVNNNVTSGTLTKP
jgi:hypothetical protein